MSSEGIDPKKRSTIEQMLDAPNPTKVIFSDGVTPEKTYHGVLTLDPDSRPKELAYKFQTTEGQEMVIPWNKLGNIFYIERSRSGIVVVDGNPRTMMIRGEA